MTASRSSFDWVRTINPDLKKLDSIPLTGSTPSFPWKDFSTRLSEAFDRKSISIKPGEICWREKNTLYEGLGDNPLPLTFSVPPLNGEICWVMPGQEVDILAALLLTKETHPLSLHDSALSESFYRFLALEALYHLTQVSFDHALSPILTNQTILPNQHSLCWDINLNIQNQILWGRLVISPEFRHAWVDHFASKQESTLLSQKIAEATELPIHLEVGKAYLSLAEWKSVQAGDFIALDRCSLDSERFDGRIMLSVNGKQIFRAKLKNGTLKILEFSLLQEEDHPMAKQSKGNNEDDEDLSELDFASDEENFDDDEDLFNEDSEELLTDHTEDEEHDFNEEEFSEEAPDEFTEETEATEENDLDNELENLETKSPTQTISQSKSSTATKKGMILPQEIPVTLTVEIGQVKMTMDKLLKLEPGNLLEIPMHAENGVDLTINGRIVGKGELIRIGEALGIRVLQLGD